MRAKLLHEKDGQRTYAAVLDTGDEVMSCLAELSRREKLTAAQLTGIGAFEKAILNYFDWTEKRYLDIPVNEQVEVASLVGDIGVDPKGDPALHVHLVLGRRDGTALAGHLASGHVRPTLELIITESPAHLHRKRDTKTGLNLIHI